MVNPLIAIAFGIIGGLIGASIYEGFRLDTQLTWDGRNVQVINTDGDFIDEFR